jgi:glycine/D-amino acid oxidase-like deaminating enzyme
MARVDADVLIVGAGIAGASLAWRLVQPGAMQRSVLLIEMEAQPGAHATGRSAAMLPDELAAQGVLVSAMSPARLTPPGGRSR